MLINAKTNGQTIKKIKSNKREEEKSKDIHLVLRYHKDINVNSVLTEISQLENVTDLETI